MVLLLLFYALFILIGGIIGHARAGSTASLVMGLVFGILLLIATVAMYSQKRWGTYFALALTFILDIFFSWRYLSTYKFNPPGLLSLLSLSVLIALALHVRKFK